MKYICLTEKGGKRKVISLSAHPNFTELDGKDKGRTWVQCPTEEIDFIAEESLDAIILIMAQYHEVETLNGQAND